MGFANHHESMHNDNRCERPAADVVVPDGTTASRDQMLGAKDDVQNFVEEGEAYVNCMSEGIEEMRAKIQAAMTKEGEEKSAEQKAAEDEYRTLVKAHDAVVGKMQELADEFNQALKDYNSQASE
ncbi:MAG: hypothetical protein U5O39_16595 [Gammaproteobacteria bacterium]|nr:hypothetical protein [Gammaproteobacteria bacterium]